MATSQNEPRFPDDPLSPSEAFSTSLRLACRDGKLDEAQDIIQAWQPAPLDGRTLSSCLMTAVLFGQISLVRLLLGHGAIINSSTIAMASRADKPNTLAIYEALVEYGWDANSEVDGDGVMAMRYV